MFKKLLLTAALTLAPFSAFAGDWNLDTVKKDMLQPTVQVALPDVGYCSGTVVYSDRDKVSGDVSTIVLTAKHCVEDAPSRVYEIRVPVFSKDNAVVSENVYKATVKGSWYKGDLALLELSDKDTLFTNVVKLADKDLTPVMGEEVWSVGYPYALTETITEGLFGSRATLNIPDGMVDKEYFRQTPPIAGGNSGGPVFHQTADGHFEQVGVNVMSATRDDFVTFSVPIDQIRDYISVAIDKKIP